jgi:hypothetical protein
MAKIGTPEEAAALAAKRWAKKPRDREEAQTRRLSALAEKAELESAKMRGELIDRARVVEAVQELGQAERDAILAWPARAAPILAADLGVDQHALQSALDASLRSHLTERAELATEF